MRVLKSFSLFLLVSFSFIVQAKDKSVFKSQNCFIGENEHLLCLDGSSSSSQITLNKNRLEDFGTNTLSLFTSVNKEHYAKRENYFCRLKKTENENFIQLNCGTLEEAKENAVSKIKNNEIEKSKEGILPPDSAFVISEDASPEVLEKAKLQIYRDMKLSEGLAKFFVKKDLNKCMEQLYKDFPWYYDPLKESIEEKFMVSAFPCEIYDNKKHKGFLKRCREVAIAGHPVKWICPSRKKGYDEEIKLVEKVYIKPLLEYALKKIERIQNKNSNSSESIASDKTKLGYVKLGYKISEIQKTMFVNESLCVLNKSNEVACLNEKESLFEETVKFNPEQKVLQTADGVCQLEFKNTSFNYYRKSKQGAQGYVPNGKNLDKLKGLTERGNSGSTGLFGDLTCFNGDPTKIVKTPFKVADKEGWDKINNDVWNSMNLGDLRSLVRKEMKNKTAKVNSVELSKILLQTDFNVSNVKYQNLKDADRLGSNLNRGYCYTFDVKIRSFSQVEAEALDKNNASLHTSKLKGTHLKATIPYGACINPGSQSNVTFVPHRKGISGYMYQFPPKWKDVVHYKGFPTFLFSHQRSVIHEVIDLEIPARDVTNSALREGLLVSGYSDAVYYDPSIDRFMTKSRKPMDHAYLGIENGYVGFSSRAPSGEIDKFNSIRRDVRKKKTSQPIGKLFLVDGSSQRNSCMVGDYSSYKDHEEKSCCYGLYKNEDSASCEKRDVHLLESISTIAENGTGLGGDAKQGQFSISLLKALAFQCLDKERPHTDECKMNSELVRMGLILSLLDLKYKSEKRDVQESFIDAVVEKETVVNENKQKIVAETQKNLLYLDTQRKKKKVNYIYEALSGKTTEGVPVQAAQLKNKTRSISVKSKTSTEVRTYAGSSSNSNKTTKPGVPAGSFASLGSTNGRQELTNELLTAVQSMNSSIRNRAVLTN